MSKITIQDVENLGYVELKGRRAALAEAVTKMPPGEVAERYVQARTDAKQRDEKLAEQGTTIAQLQEGYARQRQDLVAATTQLNEATAALRALKEKYDEDIAALRTQLEETAEKLRSETARADRLKEEAVNATTALTKAEQNIKEAVAKARIADVDQGS